MQIIIAGVSRSGKSTLAREICKRLGFFFIPGDPLISTLEELYPETGIHHCDDNRTFSPDLAVFIDRYLQHIAYEELDVVIDLYQLFPIDYQKVLRPHDIKIVYLGYSSLTAEEKLQDIRLYERKNDWTAETSDDALIKIIEQFLTESSMMRDQCRTYQIPFFDTGTCFAQSIDDAARWIYESMRKFPRR